MQVGPEKTSQFMWAHTTTRILITAIELDLFSAIQEGHKTVEDIAKARHASKRGIGMLLNALAGLGLLVKKGHTFELTPESETYLVKSSMLYLGPLLQMTQAMMDKWSHLTETVRTGKPILSLEDEKAGAEFFSQLIKGLFPLNYPTAKFVAGNKLMGPAKRILDVALGSAPWSIPFAEDSNEVSVTGIDFPDVLRVTREYIERHRVAKQFTFIEGNLRHVDFGTNQYDLAILGHICHSEGEMHTKKLLQKVYRSLVPGGKILIAEFTPNEDGVSPPQPLIFALNMLLHTEEGRTFTFGEISGMLKEAGFKGSRTLDAPAPSPLIVAEK